MIFILRFMAMLAAFVGLTQAVLAGDIAIIDAKARASLTPTTTTGAIYFSVKNSGTIDDALLSVTTPDASSTMIHETTMVNDVAKMRMIEGGLVVAAGQTVDLKTGGTHVMLMGLKAPLKPGNTVEVELLFEKAGKIVVQVPIVGPAG